MPTPTYNAAPWAKGYQCLLHELAPDVNPAGAEASMRLQYSTLDHLPRSVFAVEAKLAAACEAEEPGFLRKAAESFGMGAEYDRWETMR